MARRPRPRRSPLFAIALAVLLCLLALEAGVIFGPASSRGRRVEVVIPRGATTAGVAGRLERRGVVRSAWAFRMVARLRGDPPIMAGVYLLSPRDLPSSILRQLVEGTGERLVRVTIPEGYTLRQIADRLATVPGVDADKVMAFATERGGTLRASFRPPNNLEGYLFPDTYDFRPNTPPETMLQTMLENFDRKVATPLAGDLSGAGMAETIILASLIEREAKVPEDQPLIAGVLTNRLKAGMPLQVDATVQYVIGHRSRLLYRDLEVDSAYNTYRHAGLPPGPICSPGLPAIRAALHPADVPYLYYTARPDGTHAFSRTLAEHERATSAARAGRPRR